jgi:glycerol-3-phosphate dehydrogenase (NAD(P)+)
VSRICVLGGGSWGTALAGVLAGNGHDTLLWAREPDVVDEVNARHTNQGFLPGVTLPSGLRAEGRMAAALDGAGVVVSVVPAQFAGDVWAEAGSCVHADALVVSATKGIEVETLQRMDQVLGRHLDAGQRERFSVLSGPSFAAEVARRQPTAVVAASTVDDAARRVQGLFQNRFLRVYTNPDVIGVELGGALKNVMALAAGVAVGLGFGHNTMAALITRGLAEMARLGVAMGARRETFAGLAGMGDLVLTCTGDLSRNRTVGVRLGKGERLEDILGEMRAVAEGVKTVQAVVRLARRHQVEMPIAEEVHAMVVEGRRPATALDNLMSRDPKPEHWS